ncbi:hypothetical protein [Larkinella rosea]|uniref:Class I SAM-dependent methyltransferase n=1 Tax=Larkinella rosea TaxID=2025312 RepID=A0A3P1BCE8_9BACT|nr:hypothetical protein [Larkinella rosea]RRA98718.1 hypothetical protein EHT25_27375 [Larkinella rosea]
MKRYTEHTHFSISMSTDERFKQTLRNLFRQHRISYIIESGTFIGTGSTRTIAQAIPKNRPPESYFTVEANLAFHTLSRFNLMRWNFIKPLWGNTIARQDAVRFIQQDEALHHHERYPDVYIDTTDNPVQFYTDEVEGRLGNNLIINLVAWFGNTFLTRRENLLKELLQQYGHEKPLVILDSAGGMGWLEYQTVRDTLRGKPYWLILDDIHHLKHFRSFEDVKTRADFRIIDSSLQHGWLVAEHLA